MMTLMITMMMLIRVLMQNFWLFSQSLCESGGRKRKHRPSAGHLHPSYYGIQDNSYVHVKEERMKDGNRCTRVQYPIFHDFLAIIIQNVWALCIVTTAVANKRNHTLVRRPLDKMLPECYLTWLVDWG